MTHQQKKLRALNFAKEQDYQDEETSNLSNKQTLISKEDLGNLEPHPKWRFVSTNFHILRSSLNYIVIFSQTSLVALVCAVVDNVANCHVNHPISPKPSIVKVTGKKVLISLSSIQKIRVDKRSWGLGIDVDECLDKLVGKPLSPCKATTTLVIEATNIQLGKLLPIELSSMSHDQIVTIFVEVLDKLLG